MISHEKFKKLESVKNDPIELQNIFEIYFIDTAKANLTFLELDWVLEYIINKNYTTLRYYLEEATLRAKNKVLECIENNINDDVYEDRYRKLKELEDLLTYYLENK